MKLDRPLIFIDVESTGINPATDRIISVGMQVLFPGGETVPHYWLCNPGRAIPPESTAIHRITDEQAACLPRFESIARDIFEVLDCRDLAGFNLLAFDLPILWDEFSRAGITLDLSSVRIVDVGLIFKLKEPRTLQEAFKRYGRRGLAGHFHNALTDATATQLILAGQLNEYPDLAAMSLDDLATFSRGDSKRIDLAGKLVRDNDGDACYGFGASRGVKIKDNNGLAYWMLGKDFPGETLACLRRVLKEIDEERVEQLVSDAPPEPSDEPF